MGDSCEISVLFSLAFTNHSVAAARWSLPAAAPPAGASVSIFAFTAFADFCACERIIAKFVVPAAADAPP